MRQVVIRVSEDEALEIEEALCTKALLVRGGRYDPIDDNEKRDWLWLLHDLERRVRVAPVEDIGPPGQRGAAPSVVSNRLCLDGGL